MSEIVTIARLRWALTISTIKRSSWQTVGALLALILVVAVMVSSWSFAMNYNLDPTPSREKLMTVSITAVCASAALTVAVILIQLMILGEGSTLNPQRFAFFGIPDRRLQAGLLLAGLEGLPAVCALVSFLALAAFYRSLGPLVVVVAVVAAPIAVLTMMSLSKAVLSLATTLATSQRAQNALYLVVFVLFMSICYLPQAIVPADTTFDTTQLAPLAQVLAFTPLAAAFQLPFDAYEGAWLLLLVRVVVLALTVVLCFALSTWCLRYTRLHQTPSETQAKAHGLGIFERMPDSISGAISARVALYLRRDPRQLVFFLLPLIFLIALGLQSREFPGMGWFACFLGALFFGMLFANSLAYDGPGIHMQVMAAVSGEEDRRGRSRVYLWITSVYLLIECLIVTVISGSWRDGHQLMNAGIIALAVEGSVMAGIGVAQLLSGSLIYPVAPIDKPFSSPQGRPMSQAFFPFIQMLCNLLAMLPTLIALIAVSVVSSADALMWVLGPIGLANGAAAYFVGIKWGGKIFDRRQLRIVNTLDRYASL
ncbi:hypothetical protein KIMH_11500 [Bombiscardovia apis]|uniref:ABC transporter permease n=1 Tax=Bombiscardovia apis TaxID=2932182 RepID=A0ABN6SGA3_9BIFI|nr:ABC transporter permease [Bombiscardovia apis]BDR55039.1 hypothetical protein KIMH_11500 [Bombiscardovia apis]